MREESAFRTDLALEAREMATNRVDGEIPGVDVETSRDESILITRVTVRTAEAGRALGKAPGRYITIESLALRQPGSQLPARVMQLLACELTQLAEIRRDAVVLVVGLGNWNITPDALGPRAVDKIVVTRHLQDMLPPELKGGVRSVCAIAPGVLGITGMETAEIIRGVAAQIRPDLIIAIDALAAASSRRMLTTVQLSNTGIQPGSGVGNKRFGLSEATLGAPVLAVGVPTVVHASTIAMDTIHLLQRQAAFARYFKSLAALSDQDRQTIIRRTLPEALGDLMVTPKEVDRLIADAAAMIAGGINEALHPHIDHQNIHQYLH